MRSQRTRARIMPEVGWEWAVAVRSVEGGRAANGQTGSGSSACLRSLPRRPASSVSTAARASHPDTHPPRPPPPPKQATYDLIRAAAAALPPGPLHLVALSGIPLVFPKASRW